MYADFSQSKSQEYLNNLVRLYPNSLHAKFAQDPSYLDKMKQDKNVLDKLFEKLFNLYAAGDHAAVIREADNSLAQHFENTSLVAQVEYLKALAIGRVGRVEDFQVALRNIVDKYPQEALISPLAIEHLNFIENNPTLFVNRVNALQDVDAKRITFVDEPNMTDWPSLSIIGDYRTGIALVKEKLKDNEEIPATKRMEAFAAVSEGKKLNVEENIEALTNRQKYLKLEGAKKINTALLIEEEEEEVTQLVEEKVKEEIKLASLGARQKENTKSEVNKELQIIQKLDNKLVAGVNAVIDFGSNDYRNKDLFPDSAEYYFVINVQDAKVNLAPSRYGIGQFNRTRYQQRNINHNLHNINGENQLILIGPFLSFEEVKAYESRISVIMPEIMKIPVEIYNTFVVTKSALSLLTDGVEIRKYYQNYIEQ